jgi:hypothetical protein
MFAKRTELFQPRDVLRRWDTDAVGPSDLAGLRQQPSPDDTGALCDQRCSLPEVEFLGGPNTHRNR